MMYTVRIIKLTESGKYDEIVYEQVVPELDIVAVITTVNNIGYYSMKEVKT